jgi:hypothetical protein
MQLLDNPARYTLVGKFEYQDAFTTNNPKRRTYIREKADQQISHHDISKAKKDAKWWAFRISIEAILPKSDSQFDCDNAIKPILDAFDENIIQDDHAKHSHLGYFPHLGLFSNDSIHYVRAVEIGAQPSLNKKTIVEIFIAQ